MEQGCNLEDSTMTILEGHFAILLVIAAPDGTTRERLEEALGPAARNMDLVVGVWPLAEIGEAPAGVAPVGATGNQGVETGAGEEVGPGQYESWSVAVHGADRPGIVHAVTSVLAEHGGNVVDLATHLIGEADSPVYTMVLRVTLPAGAAGERAAAAVRRAAEDLGTHCTLRRDEAELL